MYRQHLAESTSFITRTSQTDDVQSLPHFAYPIENEHLNHVLMQNL
jgi:hypothetical protein